jgi:catechol-2,3-dioxygenase
MTTNDIQKQTLQTGHVGLNVSNLELSKKFYQEVFGFQVILESQAEGRRFVFLGDRQKLVLTLWQQSEGRFEKGSPGLHHLSFQVSDIEKVRGFENRLRELNINFIYDGIVPHAEGTQSGGIFFEDPDGIRLEIYSPTGVDKHDAPTPGAPSCGFF